MRCPTKRCILPAMTACGLEVQSGEMQNSLSRKLVFGPFYTCVCAVCFQTGCGRVYLPVSPGPVCVCTHLDGMSSLGILRAALITSQWPMAVVPGHWRGEAARAAAIHTASTLKSRGHISTLYLLLVLLSGQGQAAAKSSEALGPKAGPHTRHPQTTSVFWNV